MKKSIRLTVGQALVRFVAKQYVERDGRQNRFIEGFWGIFGHGNVSGLGQGIVECVFGAFMLRGIQSFLILLAVEPQWYILVVGLIVVLASVADRALTRFAFKH